MFKDKLTQIIKAIAGITVKIKAAIIAKPAIFIVMAVVAIVTPITLILALSNDNDGDEQLYYTVTFDVNGGNGIYQNQSITIEERVIDPRIPTRENYAFVGWYTRANGGELWDFENDIVTGNIILYARWSAIHYTVTFDSNGGNGTYQDQSVTIEERVIDPGTLTCNNYAFIGWYTQANGGGNFGILKTI
ncbi:MAG: InlB B-repeat-containing protein [Clostridiales bacterium]|jgi:uncharacterized repeat protein (TIGR02543 family)|nr:InlB B-repeat-containing protein [Clostridiales bacterium]